MQDEGKILAGQPISQRNKAQWRVTRRHAQSKKSPVAHKLLSISFALLLLCAAIWCWQKITEPQTLPITAVKITGYYNHVDHNALQQLILPYLSKGFLWIDISSLQDQLQQMPWIYSAKVKRKWPDQLIITLVEQTPMARLSNNLLVNNQGNIFAVDKASMLASLPLFISSLPGKQKLMLENYETMTAILAPLNFKITALALDERQSWSLQLANGTVVILGKIAIFPRLQRFVQAYPQVVSANPAGVASVDLRYADGLAVQTKPKAKVS